MLDDPPPELFGDVVRGCLRGSYEVDRWEVVPVWLLLLRVWGYGSSSTRCGRCDRYNSSGRVKVQECWLGSAAVAGAECGGSGRVCSLKG